jgi:radical SAM superfamily enzyme YgiQ (UPF0313 family)
VGTHPSALPEETLRISKNIDAVARREYDFTILDLAKAIAEKKDLHSVLGLSFRRVNEAVHNPDGPFIEDLDTLPFVSKVYKKHLNIRKYFFAAANYPMVMIITGRGCPYRCFFCVYPQTFHGHKYRLRSPGNVVDEFEYIVKELPQVKEIGIEDDTFTADIPRARQICELILKRKIKIKWYCNVRADLDLETMQLMKRAGCRLVTAGFESANQEVLNNMRKGIKVEQIRDFVKNAKKTGILVHGCFMAGNPGDTKETLKEDLKLAQELNCDSVQFYPLYAYPGTEAYTWAEQNGYLTTKDFSKWLSEDGYHNCVVSLSNLYDKELVQLCDKALKDYHLRFAYLWMKFQQIFTHPSETDRTIKSAWNYFSYLLKRK